MLPLLVQPQQEDNGAPNLDLDTSFIDSIFAGANQEASPFAGLLATLQQGLTDIQNRPGPEMQQVPQGVNPFVTLLATAGSQLAEQLGAQGSAQNVADQLQGIEKYRRGIQQQNVATAEEDRRARMKDMLEQQGRIIDVQLEEAKRFGTIADQRREMAAKYAIDSKLHAMQREDEEASKEKDRKAQVEVAHIYANSRSSNAFTQDKAVTTAIANLNRDLDSILNKPTSYMPKVTQPSLFDMRFKGAKPTTQNILAPEAIRSIQDHAISVARSDPHMEVKIAALSRILDTMPKDAQGNVDINSPEFGAFKTQVRQIFPNVADQEAVSQALGF